MLSDNSYFVKKWSHLNCLYPERPKVNCKNQFSNLTALMVHEVKCGKSVKHEGGNDTFKKRGKVTGEQGGQFTSKTYKINFLIIITRSL